MAQGRNAKNMIRSLRNAEGTVLTNLNDMKAEAVTHFQKVLQDQQCQKKNISAAEIGDLVDFRCSEGTASDLTRPITAAEIV